MKRIMGCGLLSIALVSLAKGEIQDPVATDLMSDQIFMKATWRMRVEDCSTVGTITRVTTTGAHYEFDSDRDTITGRQRIGRERPALVLQVTPGTLQGLRILARDTGAVILESTAGLRAKVNCDSLLMLRSAAATEVSCAPRFVGRKGFHVREHRFWVDEQGAATVFPITKAELAPDLEDADNRPVYRLQAGGEIWAVVGPARPYPWQESVSLQPLWHGSWESPEQAVPSDEKIVSYVGHGNLLWLQSEKMLWKSWHKAFKPRLPDELRRVLDTAHGLGMRVMVYASPFYFTAGLKGTNTRTGENLGLYLAAVADLLDRFPDIDGIYFDGLYMDSIRNTYACCRATRELIGPDRVLMMHCTDNAPYRKRGDWCYNPAADTWANCILRGEGQGFAGGATRLRFVVSGYQVSNTIGFVCNNAGYYAPTRDEVEIVLRTNSRLPYMTADTDGWRRQKPINKRLQEPAPLTKAKHVRSLLSWYRPRLDAPGYRAWLEDINDRGAFELPPAAGE